jgi:hypothetical protein
MAAAVGVTVVAGLASRKYPWLLPEAFGKYPGDVLWAQMVYWCVCFVAPAATIVRVSSCALAISCVVELGQLYQAPWIRNFRATTIGHLLFGSHFDWGDMLAYAIGVGLCAVMHAVLLKFLPLQKPG